MKLKFTRNTIKLALVALSFGALFGTSAQAAEASDQAATRATAEFARVGNLVITQREFDAAFAKASRNKFYHGKPPEAEVIAMRREVGDKLIFDALLLIEARRLKIKPDAEMVKQKSAEFDRRNAGSEQWQKIRERALPAVAKRFEEESLRSKLEQRIRKVRAPSEKQLRKFYAENPQQFTEPEQTRVSIILLRVDPGSSKAEWEQAREFGQGLLKQLKEGADFGELAMKYSGDLKTAPQGGDMGYLHGGMMSGLPAAIVKELKPGELSDVVNLMEGVAIFRLVERNEPKLSSFARVKDRTRTLWLEAESKRVWDAYLAQLRKKTPVKINESGNAPSEASPPKDTGFPSENTGK